MIPVPIAIVGAVCSPLVPLIVYGRMKRNRQLAAQQLAAAEPGDDYPLPSATPETGSGVWLQRFSVPERTWLREQWPLARFGFIASAWIVLLVLIIPLFPQYVRASYPRYPFPVALFVKYQGGFLAATVFAAAAAFFATTLTVVSWQGGPAGIFWRTRPLPLRFLFWSRSMMALAALEAGLFSAFFLDLVFGWSVYGHLWAHLPAVPANLPYLSDLNSSVTAWFDPMLTLAVRASLIFAGVLLLSCLPFKNTKGPARGITAAIGGLAGSFGYQFVRHGRGIKLHYLVAPMTLHDPLAVLLNLAAVAILLWLAQWRMARNEI